MIGAELQTAIYEALVGANVCGGRVYDQVPANPTFPYMAIGDEKVLEHGDSCGDGFECVSTLHVWSRPAGGNRDEVKRLVADVVDLLGQPIALTDFVNPVGTLVSSHAQRDPDGLTLHAIVTLRHLIYPN